MIIIEMQFNKKALKVLWHDCLKGELV